MNLYPTTTYYQVDEDVVCSLLESLFWTAFYRRYRGCWMDAHAAAAVGGVSQIQSVWSFPHRLFALHQHPHARGAPVLVLTMCTLLPIYRSQRLGTGTSVAESGGA